MVVLLLLLLSLLFCLFVCCCILLFWGVVVGGGCGGGVAFLLDSANRSSQRVNILQMSTAVCLENGTTTVPCSPRRVRFTRGCGSTCSHVLEKMSLHQKS